ncbi:hypothetical protein AVEN_258994-1 [Araneus ventricosus]|uniref:Uncharacterized protein n=1 Tax=Araneus ventricosus TaxID=182803 RepID=A0A4Y2ETI2_ARAVE|nr:hypothetical protein AVEN_258994-1 [Araneus ventricosus]
MCRINTPHPFQNPEHPVSKFRKSYHFNLKQLLRIGIVLQSIFVMSIVFKAGHSYLFQNGNFGPRKTKNKRQGRKPMENSMAAGKIPAVHSPNLWWDLLRG